MYQKFTIYDEKLKYLLIFLVIASLVFIAAVYKNDEKIKSIEKKSSIQAEDLVSVKEFFLKKIRSPYSNIDYIIKSGDSVQKYLRI